MINIQWTKFEQKYIVTFISEELPLVNKFVNQESLSFCETLNGYLFLQFPHDVTVFSALRKHFIFSLSLKLQGNGCQHLK